MSIKLRFCAVQRQVAQVQYVFFYDLLELFHLLTFDFTSKTKMALPTWCFSGFWIYAFNSLYLNKAAQTKQPLRGNCYV